MSGHNQSDPQGGSGITNVQLGEQEGPLSVIGRPLGKGLEKGLSPVGSAVGGLTQGVTGQSTDLLRGAGQALGVTRSDGQDKQDANSEGIGGKEQTGDNPLGL